jgi:hypothetical protein
MEKFHFCFLTKAKGITEFKINSKKLSVLIKKIKQFPPFQEQLF